MTQAKELGVAVITLRVVSVWRALRMFALREPAGPGEVHFHGSGPDTFVCGGCGSALAIGMRAEELRMASMRCNRCGRWNILDGRAEP